MSTDSELLRRYAREGSEAAFAELVGRHINVIYSAAWRQVGGDSDLAWDVTQEVFKDLARKAKRLTFHPKLVGWLYLSTRYIAAKARRSEERRRAREEKACQMAPEWSSDDSDTDWEELSPVLDEALCDLKSADREAVLLRFFESRSFSEVGRELGLNENAARMRVERALEKLRVALKRHGVGSIGSGVLANFLTHRAVSAAPMGMAAKITQTALSKAAESISAFTLVATIDAMKGKLLLGAVAIAMTAPFFWRAPSNRQAGSSPTESALSPAVSNQRLDAAPSSGSRQSPQRMVPKETTGMVSEADPGERLELHIVTADGGEPIVGATLDYRVLTGNGLRERDYITDEAGVSMIRFPSDVKEATLTSRIEGFADTTLEWRPEHGESIPEHYRLTVERAVPIGGRVVGPDGRPIADATVRIGHEAMPGTNRPESHKFGGMRVTTDDQGEWKVRRIAREMIDRLHGHASHPRYVTSDVVEFGRNATAKLKLREKRFEFQLKPGAVVRGKVTTANGFPVADANVLLGHLDQAGSRETSTDESGRFLLEGCRPGERYLTASAKGYAATTRRVEISSDSSPFNLVLNEGKTLRLRVVDRAGKPIPNAKVSLDTFHGLRTDFTKPAPVRVQTEFSRKTGAEGRVVWRHAPDQTLSFGVFAKGYMRRERVTVDPGGNEKVIALDPALSVMGTVQDAATGRPVPRFQIICGHPSREEKHEPRWSRLERFWLPFAKGTFQHTFHEPLTGYPNRGYYFKFQAGGYAPYISRFIAPDEREVRLEVDLHPVSPLTLTIHTPAGSPAPGAKVALADSESVIRLYDRAVQSEAGGVLFRADDKGKLKLSSVDSVDKLIVVHESGYAAVDPKKMGLGTVIQLHPWARITGIYREKDRPVEGRAFRLESMPGEEAGLILGLDAFRVESDVDGRFAFPPVPAGTYRIVKMKWSKRPDGTRGWSRGATTKVEARSGKRVTLELTE